MKKIFLLFSMLLPAIFTMNAYKEQLTPSILPSGVSVQPAQGLVEVAGSYGYPRGVANIGINFGYEVIVNPNCTEPSKAYLNDFTIPAVTTMARSVNQEDHRTAGVIFKNKSLNITGLYKIEIPEGAFCKASGTDADGELTGTQPTPALTLYYEIYTPCNIFPTEGIVDELENIILTFPDADEVRPTKIAKFQFYRDMSDTDAASISYTIMDYDNDGVNNEVVLNFGSSDGISRKFIDPGSFWLLIEEGSFESIVYGPNYPNDPNDIDITGTPQILVNYLIPTMPAPDIIPTTEVPVESFDSFILVMPEGFSKMLQDGMARNYIYRVNENGVVDTGAPLVLVKAVFDYCTDETTWLSLYDIDTYELLDEWKPESGFYCLQLDKALLTGTYTSKIVGAAPEFINSDPYRYIYEVQNDIVGVKEIEDIEVAEEELLTIYTLSGINVARNAEKEILNSLAPGLYIVNGKKVMKK